MAQHTLTDDERDVIVAAATIGAVASATVRGVFDGQDAHELDQIITKIRDSLSVIEKRRDSLDGAGSDGDGGAS